MPEIVEIETHPNIVIELEEKRYLLPTKKFGLLLWNMIPPFLNDPNSEEAKQPKFSVMRLALKTMLRPAIAEIAKKTNTPPPGKKDDILQWALKTFITTIMRGLARQEWGLKVEPCNPCGPGIFKIRGIAPNTEIVSQTDQEQNPGPRTDT